MKGAESQQVVKAQRKIRAHKKSKGGCGNCKLRSVKCDETKPSCMKCLKYGVLCNYDGNTSELQILGGATFSLEPLSQNKHALANIAQTFADVSSPIDRPYEIGDQDLELLSNFLARTVPTVSTGSLLDVYQKETVRLACANPFLMHAVLAATLIQDRCMSGNATGIVPVLESFHAFKAISILNERLSSEIEPQERDAMWIAAALLGNITFAQIEANDPEQCWPLTPPSSLDLNWLKMSIGKKGIWLIAQPSRPESVLKVLLEPGKSQFDLLGPVSNKAFQNLPKLLRAMFALDDSSTMKNNVYYSPAMTIARSWNGIGSLDYDIILAMILNFVYFIYDMPQEYKERLEQKEPRALLLLALIYGQVCQLPAWWLHARTTIECQAICIFLERFYYEDSDLQTLLRLPKFLCRLG